MKISIATIIATLAFANLASAASLNPNFAYDFQSGNKITFCPGVTPRVFEVGTLGATWSGSSDGYDGDFNQTRMNGMGRDMRTDVENQVRGFDFLHQTYDPSLKSQVPLEAQLVEQLPLGKGQVSVCMSKLDLVNVNQTRSAGPNGTAIQFTIAFKYFVSLDMPDGRKTVLVREAEGSRTVYSAFYNVYYDWSPRAYNFMPNSWAGLQKDIGSALAPIPNAEAEQGLARLAAYLGDYLGDNGQ